MLSLYDTGIASAMVVGNITSCESKAVYVPRDQTIITGPHSSHQGSLDGLRSAIVVTVLYAIVFILIAIGTMVRTMLRMWWKTVS